MAGVKQHTADWTYDAVTIGIPSPVIRGAVFEEPWNLGTGWVGFDWSAALGVPVKVINDAAMQALGSYEGGRMLFLGLGSGLGTALVDEGRWSRSSWPTCPIRDQTFEDLLGQRGLVALGEEAWRAVVLEGAELLRAAVSAEYVVLGGGNVRLFKDLPAHVRRGHNDKAFDGGFRAWADDRSTERAAAFETLAALAPRRAPARPVRRRSRARRTLLAAGRRAPVRRLLEEPDHRRRHGGAGRLARKTGVEALRDRMFAGEPINNTEDRAVLHVALRNRSGRPMLVDGRDVMPDVHAALDHIRRFSEAVRSGSWLGLHRPSHHRRREHRHRRLGSRAGDGHAGAGAVRPRRSAPAFRLERRRHAPRRDAAAAAIPATTLFIVASKTFTTQETMANAQSAREWFLARPRTSRRSPEHFVAVSTNEAEVRTFGIAPENMFVFWDWVGGRYSLWSSIGLPIALAVGFGHFEQLLDGAHEMDEHFRTAPLEQNLPITLGLLGRLVRERARRREPRRAALRAVPAPPARVSCSSSTWRATASGSIARAARSRRQTAAVVWGEPGTNGQHAFYQLLHQGTRLISSDFLAGIDSHSELGDHHRLLLANCVAQTEALMRGKTEAEVRERADGAGPRGETLERLVPHKVFPGNRPSTTILYDKLGPRTLGMLLAMYEHKVFTMGAIWHINSFDQWGVELGKQLADGGRQGSRRGGRRDRPRQLDRRVDRRGSSRAAVGLCPNGDRERRCRKQALKASASSARAEMVALSLIAGLRLR